MIKNYHDYLKAEIEHASIDDKSAFYDLVKHIPDFYDILSLLLSEDISPEDRRDINCALAYFVVENDILPDDVYGLFGYVDDLFVCSHVLNRMFMTYPDMVLRYSDDKDIGKIITMCYTNSMKILEERDLKDKILSFCGLE